jgi:hypothetical protein
MSSPLFPRNQHKIILSTVPIKSTQKPIRVLSSVLIKSTQKPVSVLSTVPIKSTQKPVRVLSTVPCFLISQRLELNPCRPFNRLMLIQIE